MKCQWLVNYHFEVFAILILLYTVDSTFETLELSANDIATQLGHLEPPFHSLFAQITSHYWTSSYGSPHGALAQGPIHDPLISAVIIHLLYNYSPYYIFCQSYKAVTLNVKCMQTIVNNLLGKPASGSSALAFISMGSK